MKLSSIVLLCLLAAGDAQVRGGGKRRLRKDADSKYLDLSAQVDESEMNKIKQRYLNAPEDRNLQEELPEVGSLSLSMSLGGRAVPLPDDKVPKDEKDPKEDKVPKDAFLADASMSLSMSMSMSMSI
jgi:hypothetical protein